VLYPDGRNRPPHLRSFRDGWRHLRFLLLFSPRWLFLYPGITLLVVGMVLGGILLQGPVHLTPTVEIDLHTFLMAAMFIIVGLQSVSFALIGRRFASRYGFIPKSGFDGLLEALTLERILLAAVVLVAIGIGTLIWGVSVWASRDFGPLDVTSSMRYMIMAMTSLVAGLQLGMSGFMSSMINIPLYERRVADFPPPDDPMSRIRDLPKKKS
ncbi:MAG: hypothetical protein HY371_07265, partial [Devosia nanyangense]|nr:hypothetical protein [Devosia nanyangense]